MKRNKMRLRNDKRVTLQEIADITGAAYRTVAAYAQKAGWTKNGVQSLLDETQATIIIEAMKTPASSGAKSNLAFEMQGIETSQSRMLQIKRLNEQMQAVYEAEIAELREKNQTLLGENEALETALNQSLEYSTVAKFNRINKMGWSFEQCKEIGRQLSAYCRLRNIEIRKCETEDRFGAVNSYPVTVIHDYLGRRKGEAA